MSTPQPFAAFRAEVAVLVEAARKADRDGDRPLSRSNYERAIRLLRRDEAENVPVLIQRIARSYMDDGIFDAALDCLAAAQHLSRARGDTAGVAHAVNLMATANLHRGDLESAEALYQRAGTLAETAGDTELLAMVAHNLGIVAKLRGNPDSVPGRHAIETLPQSAADVSPIARRPASR